MSTGLTSLNKCFVKLLQFDVWMAFQIMLENVISFLINATSRMFSGEAAYSLWGGLYSKFSTYLLLLLVLSCKTFNENLFDCTTLKFFIPMSQRYHPVSMTIAVTWFIVIKYLLLLSTSSQSAIFKDKVTSFASPFCFKCQSSSCELHKQLCWWMELWWVLASIWL